MERLDPKPYPIPPLVFGPEAESEASFKAQKAVIDGLGKQGKLFYTPYADSYAYYFIKSESPLILQHIDYCDGWHAPAALIRGLRLSDIRR